MIRAEQVALGKPVKKHGTAIISDTPGSLEEKVEFLEAKVQMLLDIMNEHQRPDTTTVPMENANHDGIPLGISLIGTSQKSGISVMTVHQNGYFLGFNRFDSLSAAAEEASGVRRSGWTFWKLPDGRTVKEAFGRN